jgi:hypothetical protein
MQGLVLLACFSLIALSSSTTSGTATRNFKDVESITITGPLTAITAGDQAAVQRSPQDTCIGQWQGPPAITVTNWFTGAETYAAYQDPTETGCASVYPFGVTDIVWVVQVTAPVTLDVQPLVYADAGSLSCPAPGAVLCSGPLYSIPLNSPGSYVLTLPLNDTCCVSSPYFAGVDVPTLYDTSLVRIVVDNGVLVPPRSCAAYNDYGLGWLDLVDDVGFPFNLELYSIGQNAPQSLCSTCPTTIPPGPDLWVTPPGGSTHIDYFTENPIPADFFGPGSDPFYGQICLGGTPLQTTPPGMLGPTDVVVERLAPAFLPIPGAEIDIPIEIVALSLVSCQPITVSYNGDPIEQWEVRACLSSVVPQQQGTMRIIKDCPDGGTFTSTLPVTPKLIFTRVNPPGGQQIMDPAHQDIMTTQNGHWTHAVPPPFGLWESPGGVTVDHDCFPSSPEIPIPPGSGCFYPGMTVIPCDPLFPPICGGKVLTDEEAQLAAHGVLPPQEVEIIEGACCLPTGECIITDPLCCANLEGQYQGDFTSCFPDPCLDKDCFESIGQATVTFDLGDLQCLNGVSIDLTSAFSNATTVTRTPPPYFVGQIIQTEIIQLELTGSDPSLGPVIVRERGDAASLGQVTVTAIDGGGNLTGGNSFFDIFLEIEVPNLAQTYNTGFQPLHLESQISSLPPLGDDYFPPPSDPPVPLLTIPAQVQVGWLCHGMHRPTIEVPCDQPPPTGGCCVDDICVNGQTEAQCQSLGGHYLGDGTTCIDADCPPPSDSDCFQSTANATVTLDPADQFCASGINLSLSSGLNNAIIEIDPPPYSDGQVIQTEIVQMELTASTIIGDVIVRERSDKASLGKIENVLTDGGGNLTYGESFFDVFVEVELVDLGGEILNSRDIPIRLEATLSQLPPDSLYFPPPSAAPVRLFRVSDGVHRGWLCHAEHQPTLFVPCDTGGPCCDGDGVRGNADNITGPGGEVDVADLTFLVAYLFSGGPVPPCIDEGNVDGIIGPGGPIDVADLTYLVAFLFQGGPAPAPCP